MFAIPILARMPSPVQQCAYGFRSFSFLMEEYHVSPLSPARLHAH
jgi:hypothetical protein